MIGTDSYNNPFINRDANTDSVKDIVNYWCEPEHIQFMNALCYSDKAVVIEGLRGCGKTTAFKYYSYQGQNELGFKFIDYLMTGKFFCIYHRLGEYNYSALAGKGMNTSFWENVFTHVFELKLSILLLEMIDYYSSDEHLLDDVKNKIVRKLSTIDEFSQVSSYSSLIGLLDEYLRNVNEFVRKRSMMDVEFETNHWFGYYELIAKIVSVINEADFGNQHFKVAFIIDEMENLSESNQKVINTYIKFVKENISFRVGSRPAGMLTFSTLASEEIRVNHDYEFISINPYMNTNKYEKFLIEMVNKRLKNSKYSEQSDVKIESLLGRKEDVLQEINSKIPEGFIGHFDILQKSLTDSDVENIRNDDKLKELLNIIKINRGETPDAVKSQMDAYIGKETDSDQYRKYKNAYSNKYKKSLAFLILHLANKNKSYYSIKTYSYLSSGSTRVFLQLCHKVFELADFYSPEVLYENKQVDIKLQTQAAMTVAESEMNYLKRVGPFGKEIYNLIDNICRLFRYYHNDVGLRYPETNQFTLDDNMDEVDNQIINTARMHAFIIRKNKLQQRTIGQPKTYIYTINRIYSPLYNISCVTRGGYNPRISNDAMRALVTNQILKSKTIVNIIDGKEDSNPGYKQMGIEDLL